VKVFYIKCSSFNTRFVIYSWW